MVAVEVVGVVGVVDVVGAAEFAGAAGFGAGVALAAGVGVVIAAGVLAELGPGAVAAAGGGAAGRADSAIETAGAPAIGATVDGAISGVALPAQPIPEPIKQNANHLPLRSLSMCIP